MSNLLFTQVLLAVLLGGAMILLATGHEAPTWLIGLIMLLVPSPLPTTKAFSEPIATAPKP